MIFHATSETANSRIYLQSRRLPHMPHRWQPQAFGLVRVGCASIGAGCRMYVRWKANGNRHGPDPMIRTPLRVLRRPGFEEISLVLWSGRLINAPISAGYPNDVGPSRSTWLKMSTRANSPALQIQTVHGASRLCSCTVLAAAIRAQVFRCGLLFEDKISLYDFCCGLLCATSGEERPHCLRVEAGFSSSPA